jgi:tetratricopeptide (TPR) repeat protein
MKYPGGKPTYEQLEPLYHRSVDYNVRFMEQVATTLRDKPDEYERLMLKVAKLNPCSYLALGNYFVQNKNDDKGAEYLAVAMKECQNAVASANQSEWLITYYFNKGEKEKAYKLADFAADEVYSHSGLRAKANLLEMDGKWKEALDYRKKMEERYQDTAGVIYFYLRYRMATGDSQYDAELDKKVLLFFPKGLEEVTPASFNGAPQYGVLLNGDSEELKKAGLSKGDIIVAAYGKRVYDMYQFSYLRDLSKEAGLRLIVWKNGEYAEVKASPPNRKFGVGILSYDSSHK